MFEWEEADRYSFEDSDRFEEVKVELDPHDVLCLFVGTEDSWSQFYDL
jgi:hypothetical protein